MIDYLKLKTLNAPLIAQLYKYKDIKYIGTNGVKNDVYFLEKYKIKLTFIKAFERGEFVGYRELWLGFNPHKIFNDNLHNGNDLTTSQAVHTIKNVLEYLSIKQEDYKDFTVIGLEVGVNVQPIHKAEQIINGLYAYKSSLFAQYKGEYSKIAGDAKRMQVKVYSKYTQLLDINKSDADATKRIKEEVTPNTLRYELSLKTRYLKSMLKINDLDDLLSEKLNEIISDLLIKTFDYLVIIEKPKKGIYKDEDFKYLRKWSSFEAWGSLTDKMKKDLKKRNYLNLERKKYNQKSFLFKQLQYCIKSKIFELSKCVKKHPVNDNQKNTIYVIKNQNYELKKDVFFVKKHPVKNNKTYKDDKGC